MPPVPRPQAHAGKPQEAAQRPPDGPTTPTPADETIGGQELPQTPLPVTAQQVDEMRRIILRESFRSALRRLQSVFNLTDAELADLCRELTS